MIDPLPEAMVKSIAEALYFDIPVTMRPCLLDDDFISHLADDFWEMTCDTWMSLFGTTPDPEETAAWFGPVLKELRALALNDVNRAKQ
jgi:hypothetical protein